MPGLETLEPTQGAAQLLNTFQLKGLGKILNLRTTYVQRENTNELVYSTANEANENAQCANCRAIQESKTHDRETWREETQITRTRAQKRKATPSTPSYFLHNISNAKRNDKPQGG